MALEAIAYGPDELCLLTIDGTELLAHDATTEAPKWRLSFETSLAGVVFVDPQALPAGQLAGSPWRAPSSAGKLVLVVDVDGRLHSVDPTLGQVLGKLGPFGKPHALAVPNAGAVAALAVGETVFWWRYGEQHELPLRASALAFANDGATLAVGTERGELQMLDLAAANTKGPREISRTEIRGAIVDLAQHPDGSWLVASSQGVFSGASGASGAPTALAKLSAGAKRMRFDANGRRLAVQRSERALTVYEWPRLEVTMRIEYTDRPVRGLAFGPGDWLAVGLDHGDGNKIDVVTSATHRTDTHPGREHRSWTLLVEGKKERLSAKEAEEIRRMKSSFQAETKQPGNALGARLGIGGAISIALVTLRVCLRLSTPTPSYDYKSLQLPGPSTYAGCDKACADERLSLLETRCEASPGLGCAVDVRAARKALASGHCAEAKAALSRISGVPAGANPQPLVESSRLLAKLGLDQACRSGIMPIPPVKHAQLVQLRGPALSPSIERIPEESPAGEIPLAVWGAPGGATFVATTPDDDALEPRVSIYRRIEYGSWGTVHHEARGTSMRVSIFGQSGSDVYVATDRTLAHFDGTSWTTLFRGQVALVALAPRTKSDMFFVDPAKPARIQRRSSGGTTTESVPPGLEVSDFFGIGGPSIWALANNEDGDNVLLQRSAGATWTARTPPAGEAGARMIRDVWVSPTGDAFVATDDPIFRTNGTRWTELATPITASMLWGRSSSDVYGGSIGGLVHFDGKTWSETSYSGPVAALGGTPTNVLILSTTE